MFENSGLSVVEKATFNVETNKGLTELETLSGFKVVILDLTQVSGLTSPAYLTIETPNFRKTEIVMNAIWFSSQGSSPKIQYYSKVFNGFTIMEVIPSDTPNPVFLLWWSPAIIT